MKKSSHNWRSKGVILAGLVAASCATTGGPASSARPGAGTAGIEAGLEALTARGQSTETMRGHGTVTGTLGRGNGEQAFAFALRQPSHLRIDLLGPTGIESIMLLHDDTFYWYIPAQRQVFAARADARTLRKVARLDLQPAQLIRLLAGLPPDQAGAWLTSGGQLISPDRMGEITFDASGRHMARYRRLKTRQSDAADTVVEFRDYRAGRGGEFPYRIDLRTARTGGRFRVAYDLLDVNPTLAPEVFTIQVPASTKITQW